MLHTIKRRLAEVEMVGFQKKEPCGSVDGKFGIGIGTVK